MLFRKGSLFLAILLLFLPVACGAQKVEQPFPLDPEKAVQLFGAPDDVVDKQGWLDWRRFVWEAPHEVERLRKLGIIRNDTRGFHFICATGTAEQVAEALKNGADPNLRDPERGGVRPINDASARNPDPEVIRLLAKAGADVTEQGIVYGRTPVMLAALFNPNPGPVITALAEAGKDGWK